MRNTKKALIYTRISTNDRKQKNSLSVQHETCKYFAEQNGYEVVAHYQEQMSARISDRPVLKDAINHANKDDLFIIVMKVDRLSRDNKCYPIVEPILHRLRICSFGDNNVDPFLFSILISVAAHESSLISIRTSMAMQKLKRQGRSFGCKDMSSQREKAVQVRKENAIAYARKAQSLINDFIALGYTTNKQLCFKLNECTFPTRTGKNWSEPNLYRLRKYIDRNL